MWKTSYFTCQNSRKKMWFRKIIGLHSDAVDGTSSRLKETSMSTNLHKSDKPLIRHTILSRHKDRNYVTNCIFRSMLATMPISIC